MKSVAIILLNYKGTKDTIACLDSLSHISYENYKVIIVDNASSDNFFEKIKLFFLEKEFDYVFFNSPNEAMKSNQIQKKYTVIQAGTNAGYGHGNNIGIKYGLQNNTDYTLVLNNDTIVSPNFLEPLVQRAEGDKRVGIVGGKILYHSSPKKIWFIGGKFHRLTSKVEHVYFNEIDSGQDPPKENTFITGCMWLIPSRVFKEVGFINEDYFMYVEDVEYCQRVLLRDYILKVNDKSIIYHKVGNSSGGNESEFSIYWTGKNSSKFIRENVQFIFKFPSFLALLLFRPVKWLKKGKLNLVKCYFKGVLDDFKSKDK